MVELDLEQFRKNLDKYIRATVIDGDMFTVKTKHGKFVIMEEPEYEVMREALETLIMAAARHE